VVNVLDAGATPVKPVEAFNSPEELTLFASWLRLNA
jgi:hypothetical protein